MRYSTTSPIARSRYRTRRRRRPGCRTTVRSPTGMTYSSMRSSMRATSCSVPAARCHALSNSWSVTRTDGSALSARAWKTLLGLKDVATLYELWCYFAVVDAVAEVIGRRPDYADAMQVKHEIDLGHGFRVAWNDGPTVYDNLSFTPKKSAPRQSASLWLRPDIVVDVMREGQRELHALAAKLRIDGVVPTGEIEEGEEDVEANPLSFKNDDIAKMHAYRDALPHVRSARVLYPGNEVREFPALDADARDTDGVGAIPLVPGQSPVELVRVIARITGKEPSQLPYDS